MRRRTRAGGKPIKARRRKAATLKRRNAPKEARHPILSAASLHEKVALLTRERDEALQQQTATADILRVISQSPTDAQPVFDRIVLTAVRLLRCDLAVVHLCEGTTIAHSAVAAPEGLLAEIRLPNLPLDPNANFPSRAILDKKMLHLPDWSMIDLPEHELKIHKTLGANSTLYLPLLREGKCIGLLTLVGKRSNNFGAAEIARAESYRDQALIAIENARLFKETNEALEQQTATSEVLRVISSSPGDLQPVFQAMLENAVRICDAKFGNIYRWEGDALHLVASHDTPPAFVQARRRSPFHRDDAREPVISRLLATKAAVHIADAAAMPGYLDRSDQRAVAGVELGGVRTVLAVPMLLENEVIGSFTVYRHEVRPFTDKQIALVQNFANQAVIAIENTRLLNELRQSLEQQTATAEVLSVISSSPGELQPVFQAMLENAVRICEAKFGSLFRFDGEKIQFAAEVGTPPEYAEFQKRRGLVQARPGTLLDRAARTKQVIHTADYAAEPFPGNAATLGGARSTLCVPMLKEDALVGAIFIYRTEVRPFTDKQIELVKNFAAQAVIAIENTRLLNELRELLEQQTATSEVLSVISSSPGELEPVFQAMLENAVRICDAKFGNLFLYEGGAIRPAAMHGAPSKMVEFFQQNPTIHPKPGGTVDRALKTKQVVCTVDEAAN